MSKSIEELAAELDIPVEQARAEIALRITDDVSTATDNFIEAMEGLLNAVHPMSPTLAKQLDDAFGLLIPAMQAIKEHRGFIRTYPADWLTSR